MARKPASHFEVVPIEQALPKIEPPAHLSQDERKLFDRIVAASFPGALLSGTMPSYWVPTCKPVS